MRFPKQYSTVLFPDAFARNQFVILDACVLASFSLCDTLLRLAEPPELFKPKWSEKIMEETVRVLEAKLGWPTRLTTSFQHQLKENFASAWVRSYEPLIPELGNDLKDRHVLAAAIRSGSSVILTFNLKHFRPEHLEPWGIVALHPDIFLLELYRKAPALVLDKLQLQAKKANRSLPQLLAILSKTVPVFASTISMGTQPDVPMVP